MTPILYGDGEKIEAREDKIKRLSKAILGDDGSGPFLRLLTENIEALSFEVCIRTHLCFP